MLDQPHLRLTASDLPDDVERVVRAYEQGLPGRVLAYYVTGSYHDGSAVPLSDVDLLLIFRSMSAAEEQLSSTVIRACTAATRLRLDVSLHYLHDFAGTDLTMLKLGSRLVYGQDLRPDLDLPSLDVYRRDVTWSPYRFWGQVIRGVDVLHCPLGYPAPDPPFYGYHRVRVPAWYPPGVTHGTKELVAGVTRTATAWLALQQGRQVGGKQEAVTVFKHVIGGAWGEYVEAIYRLCKETWHYAVPAQAVDIDRLSDLCHITLDFENAYFALYRTYLMELVDGTDDDRRFAIERLHQVVYPDVRIPR